MDDQVPNIGNPGERVSENEHGISFVEQGVTEQQRRACQTQPPKRRRYHHLFLLLGGIPLDKKAREKSRVAQPTDHFPNAPCDAQKIPFVPKQVREPVHRSRMELKPPGRGAESQKWKGRAGELEERSGGAA